MRPGLHHPLGRYAVQRCALFRNDCESTQTAGQVLCIGLQNTGGTVYIVRPGDTLSRVARQYGVNLYVLANVNHIYNINLIYVGQTLVIPDVTIQY
jgi:LysM repeat protein